MSDAPFVEVDGLTFRYRRGTEPAIRDVSLTISPGEVVLVAGPSGCGKSTLIRAINGLIPHAYPGDLTGFVRLEGKSTTDLKLLLQRYWNRGSACSHDDRIKRCFFGPAPGAIATFTVTLP